MAYTYCIRKDTLHDEEMRSYIVYGIEAISSDGEILLSFSDIFFDKQRAEQFVCLCNEESLSLIHLPGVVEDALEEQYLP